MMWWTIKLLGILRYPIFKTNPFGGGSWPIMTSTWRSFTSYKYGVHHASLVHRSPPGPHALRVALLLGKTTAATRAPRLNLGQRPAERRQKIWSAMLYYPILFIEYVWECLRCSSWVMWFVYCVVHHSPSHPYLGRRVLLMPTRLKRLESTGSLGWGHPSQIEAVSHWLFWMWNYGKHGRLIMFRNLVTSPVYDCNELLVFGSHHAGLHLRQDQKQMLNIVCSSEQCPMKQSVDSLYIYLYESYYQAWWDVELC